MPFDPGVKENIGLYTKCTNIRTRNIIKLNINRKYRTFSQQFPEGIDCIDCIDCDQDVLLEDENQGAEDDLEFVDQGAEDLAFENQGAEDLAFLDQGIDQPLVGVAVEDSGYICPIPELTVFTAFDAARVNPCPALASISDNSLSLIFAGFVPILIANRFLNVRVSSFLSLKKPLIMSSSSD